MDSAPPPGSELQFFEDILRLRNRHLLGEIKRRLPDADLLIIPWGAAHMPEIARGLESSGFRLKDSQDHLAIRFGGRPAKAQESRPTR
jgi:hypothetical protein